MATPLGRYDLWKRHFNNMIEGKLNGDKKMLILSGKPQQGKGESIEIVSPAQQALDMAKAKISRGVKRKSSHSKRHSPAKRRRKQTAFKKKIGAKKKKKKSRRSNNRKKSVRRR